MAVTLDSTLVGTGSINGANSIVLSAFSTGGTNRLVLVLTDESSDPATVSSVTATGLTFVKVKSVNKGTSQGNVEMWGAWAAAQQTSVVITVNLTGTNFPQGSATTYCFSGTDTTGTVVATIGATSTFASLSSSAPTANITTTRNNSLCIAAVGCDINTTTTAGSGQTIDTNVISAGGFSEINSMRQSATTATSGTVVTMNATSVAVHPYGLLAVEILSPAGVSANSNFFTFL